MKLIKYITACFIVLSAIIVNSCGEKATIDSVIPADGARIKFLHAIQGGTPVVAFTNGKKWTARLNTIANGPDSLVYGDTYPSTDYSTIPAGEITVDVKTPASANPAAATVLSGKANVENGKYYTIVAGDTAAKPRLVVINDDRSVIQNNRKTYLRFVHLVPGAPSYDIIYTRNRVQSKIATLKYGDIGSVIEYDPYPSGISVNDSLYIRAVGTTPNLLSVNLGTGLTANRLRTYIVRGRVGTLGVNIILNN